ncbi:MAG: cell cycle two-component system response regulator CpdR, partial [Caulobacter sp.]
MARILLAEDDDSLRGFLARALERAGFEVQACADGEEAV